MRRLPLVLAFHLLTLGAAAQQPNELDEAGGTIGVASGAATDDGRPLLWQTRDAKSRDEVVMAFTDGKLPYFALCDAAKLQQAWGGANSSGFCLVITAAVDLPAGTGDGMGNGDIVKKALQSCALVSEFEALLRTTNTPGRRTRANIGVIDISGAAAIFEVGPQAFARYDAGSGDSAVLVRANATVAGGGEQGKLRRTRGEQLCALPQAKPLTVRFLLQEFLRDIAPPTVAPAVGTGAAPAAPPGLLDVRETLQRRSTVAGLVCHGIKPGEDARLTTMWSLLGPPLFTVAVPLWPAAGAVPRTIAGDPRSALCDQAQRLADTFFEADGAQLRLDGLAPVRRVILFNEAKVLAQVDEAFAGFRKSGKPPPPAVLRAAQDRITKDALDWVTELAAKVAPANGGK